MTVERGPREAPPLGDPVGRLVGRLVQDARGPRRARPVGEERPEVILGVEEAGDAGAEDDADPERILAGEVEAGVRDRLLRRREAEDIGPREPPPDPR